jgi:magnesium chelatase family protein
MVGGGSGVIRPGAVSRAHRGILFLDEAPEFAPPVLDALREPLESGEVVIARAAGSARFPARFLLVAAANPCPCGLAVGGSSVACTCLPAVRSRYLARLSGPLLDRIDLRVDVHPVGRAELLGADAAGEPTDVVAQRVALARERAARRLADTPWRRNADVPGHVLRARWRLPPESLLSAERALDRGTLSARGLERVMRVAWTIADLAGHDRPERSDVDTALSFRLGTLPIPSQRSSHQRRRA